MFNRTIENTIKEKINKGKDYLFLDADDPATKNWFCWRKKMVKLLDLNLSGIVKRLNFPEILLIHITQREVW